MGQKDHVEAGAGHVLDLGSGLEYLHVAGADRQAGGADGPPAMEEQGETPSDGDNAAASPPPLARLEESSGSRAEREPAQSSSAAHDGGEATCAYSKNTHQLLCRTPCVDLGTDGPPEPPGEERDPPKSPASTPEPVSEARGKAYQAKLDFALKLGYSEETVRLVLSKLGPDTLINDILGELVKLGTKSDSEQPVGILTSTSSTSSSASSCGCSDILDGQRSDSPCSSDSVCDQDNLRPIVVDGSNVAMSHGNKEVFSCQGIQLAVDWFQERGHQNITVFVPAWRKEQSRPDAPITGKHNKPFARTCAAARLSITLTSTDQEILRRLEKEKILVFTPSRRVQGRRVVCYDDRFIVKLAYESDGIIVSNDNYRDLANEKPEWKKFIDERLLMYSFVNDKFMPPDDPLGRHGPSLENFLRKKPVMPEQKKQPCPYGKKCTYGHKCKYYHPERGAQPQRAVADELRATAKTCVASKNQGDTGLVKSHSVPAGTIEAKKGAPKRQSDPSIRALSYSDAEEKLLAKSRAEGHSNMSPALAGPPSGLSLPQDQQSRAVTHLSAPGHELYPHCESPDIGYYCVTRAYSGLSLTSRRSPDCRFPTDVDLRHGSVGSTGSECGSESSISCSSSSCDSYSERSCPGCPPDPLLEDSIHFTNPHSRLYPPHVSSNHELCTLHAAEYQNIPHSHTSNPGVHTYHLSSACGQSCIHDQPPPEAPPKRPLYPLPPHLQHQPLATRSSCPGDYHSLPQSNLQPPGSPLGRCLAPTRAESVSDSHLYEHLSAPHHHRPKAVPSWDSYYRQPLLPSPRYEPSTYQSLPDTRQASWHALPWPQDSYTQHHSSHPALHPSPTRYLSHPPPPAHSPHPPYSPHGSHLAVPPHAPPPYVPQHPESPVLGRYEDVREKVYINLCNIFPSELVSRVMARSPHVTDPQQLAAAILAEKAQSGY